MKLLLISSVLLISGFATAKESKKIARVPAQSTMTIDVKGYYVSPKADPSEIMLKGKGFGFSLGHRYDLVTEGEIDGSRSAKIKGKITCSNDDECTIVLDK
jgi:hypothetical protein